MCIRDSITISPIITRATEVNFETGDKIGVTITQNGDFVYAENKQMTYSNGIFAGDLLWYPEGNDKSQIVAYYPYTEGNTPASFTVETDQTTGYGASDFMAAKKSDVLPTTNVISMNFKHMFTKLVINVCLLYTSGMGSIHTCQQHRREKTISQHTHTTPYSQRHRNQKGEPAEHETFRPVLLKVLHIHLKTGKEHDVCLLYTSEWKES